ncbi:MAG: hypothetical protein F4138_06610 [Acidimicrobiia bacterium]|nr:hypothetical protein [Acidimicrobiia bacterium]
MRFTGAIRGLFVVLAISCLVAAACGKDDDVTLPLAAVSATATINHRDHGHDHDHGDAVGHDHGSHDHHGDADVAIRLQVVDGKSADGVQRYTAETGDDISIVVNGDTVDELHIHGYDIVVPFAPDQPGTTEFEASIPGTFEVETHSAGDLVMELEVR